MDGTAAMTAWQDTDRYQRRRNDERLRPRQISALFEADHFAAQIGLPLNFFVSVSWYDPLLQPAEIQKRFLAATKRMWQWFRRKDCQPTWLYVHENPDDGCPNVHLLIHVPKGLRAEFRKSAPGWFGDFADFDMRPNGPDDTRLTYMIKGTDVVTAGRYGARAKSQGRVEFKRCGWTQNLGAKARARRRAA